jgi:hypothetical protein
VTSPVDRATKLSCQSKIHVSCLLCTVHNVFAFFSLDFNGGLSISAVRRLLEPEVTSPFDGSITASDICFIHICCQAGAIR